MEIYPEKYYPEYCSGHTVVHSPGCVIKLYNQAAKHDLDFLTKFPVDDALYSGIFRQEVRRLLF